jgi:hypothetical protein
VKQRVKPLLTKAKTRSIAAPASGALTATFAARNLLTGRRMTKQEAERGIEILAKSVYRDLKQAGYARADIVAFASGILENITNDAREGTKQDDTQESAL